MSAVISLWKRPRVEASVAALNSKEALVKEYCAKKPIIEKRLFDFDRFNRLSESRLFEELAFCIFTPGSRAVNGNMAVQELKKKNLLFNGTVAAVSKCLRGVVRFHNNKALYLVGARVIFQKGIKGIIKSTAQKNNAITTREWLVNNVKGIGYKEASHFLRNIGMGKDIAILDTHILKNLKRFNIIKDAPLPLNKKRYLEIEENMRIFSKCVNIPLDALDLLFWSHETGFIYK